MRIEPRWGPAVKTKIRIAQLRLYKSFYLYAFRGLLARGQAHTGKRGGGGISAAAGKAKRTRYRRRKMCHNRSQRNNTTTMGGTACRRK